VNRAIALFALDPRSIRLGRLALGILLFVDLALRARDLEVFYTDAGVMPRSALHFEAWDSTWSLHALSGSHGWTALLFTLAAGAAVAIAAGWHPRIALVLSWLLATSLHARNPLLRDGQDDLFRVLLFWFIFLPTASPASAAPAAPPRRVVSMGTAGYILQLCLIYWVGVAAKLGSPWWSEGSAVFNVLSMRRYQLGLAPRFLEFPGLLRTVTHGVHALELLLPILLFIPRRQVELRKFVVIAFVALHLSFALFLNLGVFPYLSAASWLVLWPRTPEPAPELDRARVPTVLAACGLALVLALNIPHARLPRPIALLGVSLGLQQSWGVFAPNPVTPLVMSNGSYRLEAKRDDGDTLVLLADSTGENHRWRHYLANLRVTWPKGSDLRDTIDQSRRAWIGYECRRRQAELRAWHAPQVSIAVVYLNQKLGEPAGPIERVVLAEAPCATSDF
jgi:hypothetical protein